MPVVCRSAHEHDQRVAFIDALSLDERKQGKGGSIWNYRSALSCSFA